MRIRLLNSIKFDDDVKINHSIFEMPYAFQAVAPQAPEAGDDPEGTDDPNPEEPEVSVNIDMLRTGKFLRKTWYGDSQLISIDEPMMDIMIDNFNNGVMPSGVALDTNHMGEKAYGWLKSLSKEKRTVKGKEQTFLVGNFSLTSEGQNIIKDQTYKYFSIEFSPNMTQKEVYDTTKSPEGKEIPMGDIKQYGPTIIGGALTNRPFIPDMKCIPVAFSEEKKNELDKFAFISGEENIVVLDETPPKPSGVPPKKVVNSVHSDKNVKNKDDKNIEPNKVVFNLSGFSFKKESNMKFDASKNMIKFMEEKIAGLDKTSSEFSELESNIKSAKEELALAEKENKDTKASFDELAVKFVKLEGTVQESAAQLVISKERSRQADLKQFKDELLHKGHAKPLVTLVHDFLLADKSENEVLTFGEAKTPMKLKDIFVKFMDAIPEGGRVPVGEESSFRELDNPDADSKKKTEAEKLSEKHKDAIEAGHKAGISRYQRKKSGIDSPAAEKN